MTFSFNRLPLAARLFSLVGISTFAFANPTQAATFSNGSFENGLNDWTTIGDVSTQGTISGSAPTDGSSQVVLTTSSSAASGRPDEVPLAPGTYNFSGNDPANAQFPNFDLQNFLGVAPDALNVASNIPGIDLTPFEGSALKQTFSVSNPFTISFDWNFLSNDGNVPFLSSTRDFGFVAISKAGETPTIEKLASSSGNFPSSLDGSNFNQQTGIQRFVSKLLDPGTYTVAFGVVDLDGTDKTSALVVDKVVEEEVPEPLTILASTIALGLGASLKREFSNKKKN